MVCSLVTQVTCACPPLVVLLCLVRTRRKKFESDFAHSKLLHVRAHAARLGACKHLGGVCVHSDSDAVCCLTGRSRVVRVCTISIPPKDRPSSKSQKDRSLQVHTRVLGELQLRCTIRSNEAKITKLEEVEEVEGDFRVTLGPEDVPCTCERLFDDPAFVAMGSTGIFSTCNAAACESWTHNTQPRWAETPELRMCWWITSSYST